MHGNCAGPATVPLLGSASIFWSKTSCSGIFPCMRQQGRLSMRCFQFHHFLNSVCCLGKMRSDLVFKAFPIDSWCWLKPLPAYQSCLALFIHILTHAYFCLLALVRHRTEWFVNSVVYFAQEAVARPL